MEYNTINKKNMINHLIIWTTAHDIFYKISYHTQKVNIHSKYLPSVKEFINSIEFVVPRNDSQTLAKDQIPSFMTINNTKEEKKKQPSFMITQNNTVNNILLKEKTSISTKEPNEDLATEELVNETIALENQTIDSQIDKISKDNNNPMISTQKDKENRTFGDCYSGIVGFVLLASMFTPYTIDLNDPEMKKFLSNMCNFYFDKTGIWINIPENNDLTTKYGQEFYNKYGNTMPESLKQFSEYSEQDSKSEDIAKSNNTLGEEQGALDPEMFLNKLLSPTVVNASALGDD